MNTYCTCKDPEIEEFDMHQYYCVRCNKEIEPRHEDAPEPDCDDDAEHYDMDKAQEEADNLDAESHLLQVDEPMI